MINAHFIKDIAALGYLNKINAGQKLRWSHLLSSADGLCKQFVPQIRPDTKSGLIWIQTILPRWSYFKINFEK